MDGRAGADDAGGRFHVRGRHDQGQTCFVEGLLLSGSVWVARELRRGTAARIVSSHDSRNDLAQLFEVFDVIVRESGDAQPVDAADGMNRGVGAGREQAGAQGQGIVLPG